MDFIFLNKRKVEMEGWQEPLFCCFSSHTDKLDVTCESLFHEIEPRASA